MLVLVIMHAATIRNPTKHVPEFILVSNERTPKLGPGYEIFLYLILFIITILLFFFL